MRLTKSERRILELLRDRGESYCGHMAWLLYGQSPAWNRSDRLGRTGSSQKMALGAQLWRMQKKGLVIFRFSEHVTYWRISIKGSDALNAPPPTRRRRRRLKLVMKEKTR